MPAMPLFFSGLKSLSADRLERSFLFFTLGFVAVAFFLLTNNSHLIPIKLHLKLNYSIVEDLAMDYKLSQNIPFATTQKRT